MKLRMRKRRSLAFPRILRSTCLRRIWFWRRESMRRVRGVRERWKFHCPRPLSRRLERVDDCMPVRIIDRCVALAHHEPRLTAGFACRIEFPHYIGEKQDIRGRDAHGCRDGRITRAGSFWPGARIEISRNERRQIAKDGVAEE